MNYRIVGNDGKTYGPVSAEQIRLWITQRRADQRTPVLAEDAGDWNVLGLRPEFAADFSTPPPTIVPVAPRRPLPTNQFALWGFICGLLACFSWWCCCCPLNVVGLILSLIALTQINAHPGGQQGKGLAIAGIVCSALSLLASFGFGLVQLFTNSANAMRHWDGLK